MKNIFFVFCFFIIQALIFSCGAKKPVTLAENIAAGEVKPKEVSFKIEGMTCPKSCVNTVNRTLQNQEGVLSYKINFSEKSAVVEFDELKTDVEQITLAIAEAGPFEATLIN
jgi:copper chaperone CopZ